MHYSAAFPELPQLLAQAEHIEDVELHNYADYTERQWRPINAPSPPATGVNACPTVTPVYHSASEAICATSPSTLISIQGSARSSMVLSPSIREQKSSKTQGKSKFRRIAIAELLEPPQEHANNESIEGTLVPIGTKALPSLCTLGEQSDHVAPVEMNSNSLPGFPDLDVASNPAVHGLPSTTTTDHPQQSRVVVFKFTRLRHLLGTLLAPRPITCTTMTAEGSEVDVMPVLRWKSEGPYLAYIPRKYSSKGTATSSKLCRWHCLQERAEWRPGPSEDPICRPIKKNDDVLVKLLPCVEESSTTDMGSRPARILQIRSPRDTQSKLAFAVVLWYYDQTEVRATIPEEDIHWPPDSKWIVSDHIDIVDCRAIEGCTTEVFHREVSLQIWLSTVERRLVEQPISLNVARKSWCAEEPIWRKKRLEYQHKRRRVR